MLEWWAYRHTNGHVLVKRYFGLEDLTEAKESPFVDQLVGPYMAKNREEAVMIATDSLGGDTDVN